MIFGRNSWLWPILAAFMVYLLICSVTLLEGCSTVQTKEVQSQFFAKLEGAKVYVPSGWPDMDKLRANFALMSETTFDLIMWKEGKFTETRKAWHIIFSFKPPNYPLEVLFYMETNYKEKTKTIYVARDNKPVREISVDEMRIYLRKIWAKEDKEEGI